ncbi:MAG: hypothetical protein RRA92_05855 [Gemmatimonadota bacterium]|nr:hypothetical protein [Gemmatimonadota bacterium]
MAIAVLAAACGDTKPDLERLYAVASTRSDRTPVIFVPGVMGSRLTDDNRGKEIWPGGFFTFLTGRHFSELSLPVGAERVTDNRDAVRPTALFYKAAGKDFYNNIVETLTGPGDYRCDPADDPGPYTDCYLFAWDWRRDLVEAATRLDELIEHIRRVRGEPDLKVDIVAHSAGSLVTRYFIRYGGRDVLDEERPVVDQAGSSKVRRAILIAAPNYGSVSGLQRAIMGSPVGPLAKLQPEVLATMPSLYELLPHPDRDWMIDNEGKRIERDLYAVETWQDWHWSIFDPKVRERIAERFADREEAERYLVRLETFMARALERGERFHRSLSIPVAESQTEFIVFGGSCVLTSSHCALEKIDGKVMIRLNPDELQTRMPGVDYARLMLEPGDGTVTKSSLMARGTLDPDIPAAGYFPLDYVVFICKGHAELPGDITFRDNLLNILLY